MIKVETKSKVPSCYLCGDPLKEEEPAHIVIKAEDGEVQKPICGVCEYICSKVTEQNESFNNTIDDE